MKTKNILILASGLFFAAFVAFGFTNVVSNSNSENANVKITNQDYSPQMLASLFAEPSNDLKCGEGKCGGDKKKEDKKVNKKDKKEMKCGEGKCGGDKKKVDKKDKKENKCGEGKCGGDKKKTDKKENKCGEGKCGGDNAKDCNNPDCKKNK